MLLVEGTHDYHVTRHILELYKASMGFNPEGIAYRDMQGFPELIKNLDNAIDSHQKVGIIVDANSDLNNRWKLIAGRLVDVGITVTGNPDPNGVVISSGNRTPRVGVWLMPNNGSSGELEDFVYEMIPNSGSGEDAVWPLAQSYIESIPPQHRKFGQEKTRKAEVHAWLAARKKPGLMGMAIAAGDLDTKGDLCQRFVAWLRRLYG